MKKAKRKYQRQVQPVVVVPVATGRPGTLGKLYKAREEAQRALDRITIAIEVFEEVNRIPATKLAAFDRAVNFVSPETRTMLGAHGNGNGNGNGHHNGNGYHPSPAARAAVELLAPPAAELNDAEQRVVNAMRPYSDKTPHQLKTAGRALRLLDAMRSAGIDTTKANVDRLYCDVLKWGTRPLVQSMRHGEARLRDGGWFLTAKGLKKITRDSANAAAEAATS